MHNFANFVCTKVVPTLCWTGLTAIMLPATASQAFTITGLDFIGQTTFPTATEFQGTQVGGLSGITYDAGNQVFYSIADDRSPNARFYTLSIDLSDGALNDGDVEFENVTILSTANGSPFANLSLDPEGIAVTERGTVFISSEGDAIAQINPFVNEFSRSGQQVRALPVPPTFLPTPNNSSGIRNNLAFESLALTPDQRFLVTATENALFQDGPAASLTTGSQSRILKYDLATGLPAAQFLYNTDPVALPPNPVGAFNTNGLVELLALDNSGDRFLALERSFSVGAVGTPGNTGNTVKLYEVSLAGATDISGIDSLAAVGTNNITAASKTLLLDFTSLGIAIDNLEGLTFGPTLADGRRSLIVISDNNFSPTQFTQFLAFAVEAEPESRSVPEPSGLAGLVLLAIAALGSKQLKRN